MILTEFLVVLYADHVSWTHWLARDDIRSPPRATDETNVRDALLQELLSIIAAKSRAIERRCGGAAAQGRAGPAGAMCDYADEGQQACPELRIFFLLASHAYLPTCI